MFFATTIILWQCLASELKVLRLDALGTGMNGGNWEEGWRQVEKPWPIWNSPSNNLRFWVTNTVSRGIELRRQKSSMSHDAFPSLRASSIIHSSCITNGRAEQTWIDDTRSPVHAVHVWQRWWYSIVDCKDQRNMRSKELSFIAEATRIWYWADLNYNCKTTGLPFLATF